jgi:hypothetical protein
MTTHEPKCVIWKRKGAELVAAETSNLTSEQETQYWRKKTAALRKRKEELTLRQMASAVERGAEQDI